MLLKNASQKYLLKVPLKSASQKYQLVSQDDQAQYEIGAHEPVQDMYMVPHDEGVSEDMYEMPDTTDQGEKLKTRFF